MSTIFIIVVILIHLSDFLSLKHEPLIPVTYRDCDVIQEKTDELTDLVKGLHSRLDAQKQAKIDALQEKVKEYEKEMDRLRDLIGLWILDSTDRASIGIFIAGRHQLIDLLLIEVKPIIIDLRLKINGQ